MSALSQTRVFVAESVLLDARLALYHERQKWLAIADLHFGFELSQRAAGCLVPWWGMESTQRRLFGLVAEYRPRQLIFVGDLVHDAAAAAPVRKLLSAMQQHCDVIAIAGNHDRELRKTVELVDCFKSDGFEFHHGHCHQSNPEAVTVTGHLHPAAMLRDGAGLQLKFPAFVQEQNSWILPAFSPWSAGSTWTATAESRIWICTPRRILSLSSRESLT